MTDIANHEANIGAHGLDDAVDKMERLAVSAERAAAALEKMGGRGTSEMKALIVKTMRDHELRSG